MMYGGYYGAPTVGQQPPRSPALRNYLDTKKAMQPAVNPSFGNTQGIPPAPRYTGSPMFGAPTQLQSQTPMQPQSVAPPPAQMQSNPFQPMMDRKRANEAAAGLPSADRVAATKDWTPEQHEMWNRVAASIRSGPDYAGKNAMYNTALGQLEMMFNLQNAQDPVDLSGYSEVADQYGSQRERLMNDLAAGGFGGSGVMAGAMSNLAGSQARAQGSFVRDALEQRRREELAQMNSLLQRIFGMQQQGLERVYGKEDEPSFWEDALGVVGGVVGSAIPGVGDVLGGIFGGNNAESKPQSDGYMVQDDDYGFLY